MIVAGIPLHIVSEASTDSGWSNPAAIIGTPSPTPKTIEPIERAPLEMGTTQAAVGVFGRPGPEQRAENRARMVEETGDALVKYGMVAGTLLFSPNPIMKVWSIIQAFGIETQSDY
jgi:hypothetical protein|tara:strand:+ start:131 stop:478 length:348 start_codon:yes stop_codon:yes gene_type:complete